MYKIGDIIPVKVTGVENYGIFVKVDEEFNGLIHISEVDNSFVKDINKYVKVGEDIHAVVLEVDEETKHMKMSIRYLNYNNNNNGKRIIKDNINGFLPIANSLDDMIKEKLEEIKRND